MYNTYDCKRQASFYLILYVYVILFPFIPYNEGCFTTVLYIIILYYVDYNLSHLIYQGTVGSNNLHEIEDKFLLLYMSCHEYGMHIISVSFHITDTSGCHSLRAYHFTGLSLRTHRVHKLLLCLFSFLIIG